MSISKTIKDSVCFTRGFLLNAFYFSDRFFAKSECGYDVLFMSNIKQVEKLCLFASFNKHSEINEDIYLYLRDLSNRGFSIMFITTSENVLAKDITKLKDYCFSLVLRENISLDFGSWKTGLDILKNNNFSYDSLLLVNDSVLGPLSDFSLPSGESFGIFGITDNYAISHHVQSYFLYVSKTVITSAFFEYFWNEQFKFIKGKDAIIKYYEIGFSKIAKEFGVPLTVLIPYKKVLQIFFELASEEELNKFSSKPFGLNPTHYFFDVLITKMGMPFLKKDLFRFQRSEISFQTKLDNVLNFLDERQKVIMCNLIKEYVDAKKIT